ncbi:MAG: alpha/beta hydrolase, partial [Pseudomonadota bacterium]
AVNPERVAMFLRAKGKLDAVEIEEISIMKGVHKQDDYRALSPFSQVPTLVLHARGDRRIPFETGRDIAARIPGAQFVGLETDGHLLLGREPASQEFVSAVRQFLHT